MRKFDGQSSIKIDPHDNNVEREVTESNENRKQKIDNNVYNQPNLEIINLKKEEKSFMIFTNLMMVNGCEE